jgi:hypothetical protein
MAKIVELLKGYPDSYGKLNCYSFRATSHLFIKNPACDDAHNNMHANMKLQPLLRNNDILHMMFCCIKKT